MVRRGQTPRVAAAFPLNDASLAGKSCDLYERRLKSRHSPVTFSKKLKEWGNAESGASIRIGLCAA
jgi:hypothetical protein